MTPDELKAWRKKHGHTQVTLAGALSVIPLTVSRWERGVREIPSFLSLALEALESKGGGKKQPRDTTETKTRKEGEKNGNDLSQG
jgi:transcriptional regulator with XRE-family HTH domain